MVGEDKFTFTYTEEDQEHAFRMATELGIYIPEIDGREVNSKLAIQTGSTEKLAKDKYKRVTRIYQCSMGTDHTVGHQASKKRQRPWENVACTMYARVVTTNDANNCFIAFNEISGFLTHSSPCEETTSTSKTPIIPLNPEIRDYALGLLRKFIPWAQVRLLARDWASKKWGNLIGDQYSRYVLQPHDSTSLYRTLMQERGISRVQISSVLLNIDTWFRASNPQPPSPMLSDALLYYQAPGPGNDDRLIMILATARQREMAWRFGHNGQVLMDGTFGLCSSAVLVFFLMVVDNDGRGIPIAEIIFTPKKDAKAAHASYDKTILTFVLAKFKEGMGLQNGESFNIRVGNTDNDKRERYALQQNWPDIQLILCTFHSWQAWRNKLNKALQVIPTGPDRQEVRKRLGEFLVHLLREVTEYSIAVSQFNEILAYFRSLAGGTQMDQKKSKAGLVFLTYFKDYIDVEALWKSWSRAGALEAAKCLGVSVDSVPRSTNHLESFHSRVKNKYFDPYSHAGRLPRLDSWLLLLVTDILPHFFKDYDERRETANYYENLRHPTARLPHSPSHPPPRLRTKATAPKLEEESLVPEPHEDHLEEVSRISKLHQDISDDNYDEAASSLSEPELLYESSPDPLELSTEAHEWLGAEMQMDVSGEGCSYVADELQDFFLCDVALDSSQIRPFLPTPPSADDTAMVLDESFQSMSLDSQGKSPTDAVAWQEFLKAEDHFHRCARNFITVSHHPEKARSLLQPRLGPHAQQQLDLVEEEMDYVETPSPSSPPTPFLPPPDLPKQATNPIETPELVPQEANAQDSVLTRQLKSKRIPSYGIR
ncbi:hypothetical protein ONZ45_g9395 [Pleurotus djamor]|nr:hypothetical protein ONZ45_g9395 [Pleurotus djamor]